MRWALAATIVILSLGGTVYFLMHDEGDATRPTVVVATVDAAGACTGDADNASHPGDAPAQESTPVPIQGSPFREEKELPEKLLVRIVTGSIDQEKLVLAADIRFQTGTTRQLGSEVLEDRQTTRRTRSNRWGEATFAMPRSGAWWLEVSKGAMRTDLQGTAEELQDGLLVVRLVEPCALRVTLKDIAERIEVETGYVAIAAPVRPVSGQAVVQPGESTENFKAVSFMTRHTAGGGDPLILNPTEGRDVRVVVRCVARGLAGWLDVPALAKGEVRDVTLALQRGCVVTARLPSHWPAEEDVEVVLAREGPHGPLLERQQLKAADEVQFLLMEPGHRSIMAKRRQSDGICCAFKELNVFAATGSQDAGILEEGPANVHIKLRIADDVRVQRDAVLDLLLSEDHTSSGPVGWSHTYSFCPRMTREFHVRGLPLGFALDAELAPGNPKFFWGSESTEAQRGFGGRAAKTRKGNRIEPEIERACGLDDHCEMPGKHLVLTAGMNPLELLLKRKPIEERNSHLVINIAPPPMDASHDNRYAVKFRTEDSFGSNGCSRAEGVWSQWFTAGTKEVEVLITCGDHVIGPRMMQLNPGGEAEVSLEAWRSSDTVDVSAVVARFSRPFQAMSPRSAK